MSHRREHLESSIKRMLGKLIAGLNDPRIEGIVSITQVKITPDGRTADVFVSVLPEDKQATTMLGLKSASGHLQTMVGRSLRTRVVPRLAFITDESIKKQAKIFAEIKQVIDEADQRSEASDTNDDDDSTMLTQEL